MFCGHDKPHLRTNQLRAQVRVPNVEPCKTDWRQIGLKSMPSASSPLLSTSGSSSEALVYSGLGLGGLEVEASSSFGTENQLEPRFVLCVPFDLVCNSSKLPGCYLKHSGLGGWFGSGNQEGASGAGYNVKRQKESAYLDMAGWNFWLPCFEGSASPLKFEA